MVEGQVDKIKQYGKAFNICVDDTWYGFGFEKPDFEEGATIKFDTKKNGRYVNVDNSTVELVEKSKGKPKSSSGGGMNRNDYWDKKAEDDKKRQKIIQLQSERNSAIAAADVIIQNGLVSLPKQADKLDFFKDLVAKLSQEFANETEQLFMEQEEAQGSTGGDELD